MQLALASLFAQEFLAAWVVIDPSQFGAEFRVKRGGPQQYNAPLALMLHAAADLGVRHAALRLGASPTNAYGGG